MNKKYLLAILSLFLLGCLTTAKAGVVHSVKWTGQLTITGFSTVSGNPLNDDNNPFSMIFKWDIAPGVGNTQTIGTPSGGALITTGTATIIDLFGTNDFALNPDIIASALPFLPVGTVNFGPGVVPQQVATGAPFLGSIQVVDGNIDSTLSIEKVDFDGLILLENVLEAQNPGALSSLAGSFDNFDQLFGNSDGSISRRFEVDLQVSEVPLPAAVWLFMTGIAGIVVTGRRKS